MSTFRLFVPRPADSGFNMLESDKPSPAAVRAAVLIVWIDDDNETYVAKARDARASFEGQAALSMATL